MPNYFAVLGLSPGRYRPDEVQYAFHAERRRVLPLLDDPRRAAEAREQLELIHRAYRALHDVRGQFAHWRMLRAPVDPVAALRDEIELSLEDGLLRHTRRRELLDEARRAGLTEFQGHLLIAEVQFGSEAVLLRGDDPRVARQSQRGRAAARLAAAGMLAGALLVAMVSWVG